MPDDPTEAERSAHADQEHEPLPSLDLALPRRRIWPVFVVLSLLVGAVALFVWRSLNAPHPTRVLVAIDIDGTWWQGSKAGAEVADRVSEYLEQLGFQPVRAGDPEVEAILEDAASPEEAAEKLRAAWIITGTVVPEIVELPVVENTTELAVADSAAARGGYFEVRAEAVLELRHVDEDEAVATIPLMTFAGAKSAERAIDFLAGSVARHAIHGALPAMVRHESIEALASDPKLFDEVAKGKNYARSVELHAQQAEEAYANLDDSRRKEASVTFSSPPHAEDRLLAVTSEGVLVATSDARPFFTPDGQQAVKSSDLETVRLRPFDGGEGAVWWRGYQAFTYPSAPPSGAPVALVESFYGYSRSLTVIEPGREMRRLWVTGRRISEPRISPSGKAVAFVDMECKQCPREIAVFDLVAQKEIWRLRRAEVLDMHHGFRWLDGRRLLVIYRAAMGADDEEVPPPIVRSVDVASGEQEDIFEIEGELPSEAVASGDGKRIALTFPRLRSLVLLAPGVAEPKRYEISMSATALSFSPDGHLLAFEAEVPGRSASEIAVLDLKSGKTTMLTKNEWPDQFPLFSPDGKRVFFEARNDDPALRRRQLIRVASVPLP